MNSEKPVIAEGLPSRVEIRDRGREARECDRAIENLVERLEALGIRDAHYLLRGWQEGEFSAVEVYERAVRILEKEVRTAALVATGVPVDLQWHT